MAEGPFLSAPAADIVVEGQKNIPNGIAGLDINARISTNQLPTSVMQYKGAYNANTNTPSLSNGTGTAGDFYVVSVAGTRNFGAGSITFGVGDAVIYSGTVYEKIPATDLVTSVAGRQGIVTLSTSDISGLGTAATHASTDFDAAGAAATAQSTAESFATSADTTVLSSAETYADTNKLAKSANLSDLNSASTARTNLGLGSAAQNNTGDFISSASAPAGAIVGTTDTQTLTNKRITKRVQSITDATSITMDIDNYDNGVQVNTQSAGTLTINAPTGTPTSAQIYILRIKSTNTQTFSFNTIFRGSTNLVLPATSSGSSLNDYLGFIYNSTDSKWDLVAYSPGY